MTINQRKDKFVQLGKFLSQFKAAGIVKEDDIQHNDPFFDLLQEKIFNAVHHNGWFTKENILFSLEQWSAALTQQNLDKWLEPYSLEPTKAKSVGVIMAGNIPLVGFHDFLSVLISGHHIQIKQSSNDQSLLPILANYLKAIAPQWKDAIEFIGKDAQDTKLKDFDAVIATGSNNTARYFEYYFKGKPSIIRKNRNSVAVLTQEESFEELSRLGEDIFRYYGLGCRNVSKLYVPKGYDFDAFFKAIYPWNSIINENKYANNYDYNKAVYLMSEFKLLDNGFLMLKEDEKFGSPIATLFYETFEDLSQLKDKLRQQEEAIQCVVGKGVIQGEVAFGQTQHPELWQYADNVDTLKFLAEL